MKVTLDLSDAKKACNQALRTCDTKAKDRIEADFIFKYENGLLTISSLNDYAEQSISLTPESCVADEGESFCVSGQAVVDILKTFPDDCEKISCGYSAEGALFGIATEDGSIQFAFNTSLPDTYAPMRFEAVSAPITINGAALGVALSDTSYAASSDGSQAPLTAVRVEITDTKLVALATDTERIAGAKVELDMPIARPIMFTVPREVSSSLGTLLHGADNVELTLGKRHVRVEWDNTQFTSLQEHGDSFSVFDDAAKCLEGREVAYGVVDRILFLKALKRASTVAKDAALRITLSPDKSTENGGKAKIETDEREKGKGLSKEELDMITLELDESLSVEQKIEVIVPCKQLLKAIEAIPDETMDVSVRDMPNGRSALLVSNPAGDSEHLVFPVSLKKNDE